MNMQVLSKCVQRASTLAATTLVLFATMSSPTLADIFEFEFHGKDTSAVAAGDIDATFRITGDKTGANINVTAVEIAVIDGGSSATNLFAALGMYHLKEGSDKVQFPISGVTAQPTSFTITNGRDTNLPGNVWKLDINGKNAALRTHGDAMDVSFKGTLAPKSQAAAIEGAKTMYIVGGIIIFATLGTSIYLLENYRKRKERRRKRRRSLLVDDKQNKSASS
jgi:hypothetical protein